MTTESKKGYMGLMGEFFEKFPQGEMEPSVRVKELYKLKDLIQQVNDLAVTTPIYKTCESERENFIHLFDDITGKVQRIDAFYIHFLKTVVDAPTQTHIKAAVVLCIPLLYQEMEKYHE